MEPTRKYQQVADLLRAEIAHAGPAGLSALPSERLLAARHEVDRSTIRRALGILQGEGLIHRRAGRRTSISDGNGNSSVHGAAQRLQVAFVARATPRGWATFPLLEGVESVLTACGCDLTFYPLTAANPFDMERQELERLEFCRGRPSAGVIYWPQTGRATLESLRGLEEAGIPVVLVDQHLPVRTLDFAGTDSVAAAYQATEHLIRAGHRRIAHLTRANTMPTTVQRAEGYRRAMEDYGLPLSDDLIVRSQIDGDEEALEAILHLHPRPTAVFAINDLTALALVNGLLKQGIRVPAEIAVVGIDDLPVSRQAVVPLTTVRQPFREMGAEAARLLMGRIEGSRGQEPMVRRLQSHLVVRVSCGAVKATAEHERSLLPLSG